MKVTFTLLLVLLKLAAVSKAGDCPGEDGLTAGGSQILLPLNPPTDADQASAIIQSHYPNAFLVADLGEPSRGICCFGGFAAGPVSPGRADAAADFLCSRYSIHPGCSEDAPADPAQPFRWVEAIYDSEACEGHTGSIYDSRPQLASIYATQYAASILGLSAAHSRSTGRAVLVAVLDTGVDAQHPALAGHIAPGGTNVVRERSQDTPRDVLRRRCCAPPGAS